MSSIPGAVISMYRRWNVQSGDSDSGRTNFHPWFDFDFDLWKKVKLKENSQEENICLFPFFLSQFNLRDHLSLSSQQEAWRTGTRRVDARRLLWNECAESRLRAAAYKHIEWLCQRLTGHSPPQTEEGIAYWCDHVHSYGSSRAAE